MSARVTVARCSLAFIIVSIIGGSRFQGGGHLAPRSALFNGAGLVFPPPASSFTATSGRSETFMGRLFPALAAVLLGLMMAPAPAAAATHHHHGPRPGRWGTLILDPQAFIARVYKA